MTSGRTQSDASISHPRPAGSALMLVIAFSLMFGFNSLARAQTFTVLHKFKHLGDGAFPAAGVIRDAKGDLYGTTGGGGAFGYGAVFKLQANGKETVLHSFTGGDGFAPFAGLLRDAEGNLYGTTKDGGTSEGGGCIYGCGTVFKLDKRGRERVLHAFTWKNGDGALPVAPLVRDGNGHLYGVTSAGGAGFCDGYGCGMIFRISKSGKESAFYSFTGGTDGLFPAGGLVLDANGNLYGATTDGGNPNGGYGTLFKVHKDGKHTVLYMLDGKTDGANPFGSLVRGESGNLYGTARNGGDPSCGEVYGCGTVFELDNTGKFTVLYSFTGQTDGGHPETGLVRDRAGNLYGTTSAGGDMQCSCGVVFKLEPNGNFTVLHSFTGGADGIFPNDLLLDAAGNLYGTTPEYGITHRIIGSGVVFKLTP
jgi:uncharacterized repeat protein (TIGR03803 family)